MNRFGNEVLPARQLAKLPGGKATRDFKNLRHPGDITAADFPGDASPNLPTPGSKGMLSEGNTR